MPIEYKDGGRYHGSVGIVVSRYNDSITNRLLEGALQTLREAEIAEDKIHVARVPGAWELPVAAQRLARRDEIKAVICLGAVIQGETTHDQYINHQVSASLGQLALEYDLPVLFGVLTCQTMEQALNRAGGSMGNKGVEAARAALEMMGLFEELK
ncbi:MAG: 6,7-dimethyl-8-ribityllumazine synthase [Planctomycetota bacterium]|nr:6,7-dimethyl-8-ribityllumazine synthase [Planctomycetota bacterium]